ncbi:MAG: type II secretion system GspH family protein [Dehalococcoidia bacterium]|nr:type II secretion system GspH family protein [Dehalococcoidia bacterium]
MTIKQRKPVAAFTLIEVMAAVLIVTIVIAGGSFLFVTGRGQINLQKHYRVATLLAAQKLEELKAGPYGNIVCDSNSDSLEGVSYTTQSTVVVNTSPSYKEVTVTVGWLQGNNSRNVSMVTCIAP